MTYSRDHERIFRFLCSCLIIGFGATVVTMTCRRFEASTWIGMLMFVAYLMVIAVVIVAAVSRLYRQHEIRKFKFDLANLIILTFLVAMPFAIANGYWELLRLGSVEETRESKVVILLSVTAFAGFLMLPVLFVIEALLSWYKLVFHSKVE